MPAHATVNAAILRDPNAQAPLTGFFNFDLLEVDKQRLLRDMTPENKEAVRLTTKYAQLMSLPTTFAGTRTVEQVNAWQMTNTIRSYHDNGVNIVTQGKAAKEWWQGTVTESATKYNKAWLDNVAHSFGDMFAQHMIVGGPVDGGAIKLRNAELSLVKLIEKLYAITFMKDLIARAKEIYVFDENDHSVEVTASTRFNQSISYMTRLLKELQKNLTGSDVTEIATHHHFAQLRRHGIDANVFDRVLQYND